MGRIDLARLHRAMQQRGEGRPWDLDLVAIAEALRGGNFRVTSVRPHPGRNLVLSPPPGLWVRDDPFATPLHVAAATPPPPVEVTLVEGFHRLLQASPDGGRVAGLAVQVSAGTPPLTVALGMRPGAAHGWPLR